MSLYTLENGKLTELLFVGMDDSTATYRCSRRPFGEIFNLLSECGGGEVRPNGQIAGYGTIVCGRGGEKLARQTQLVSGEDFNVHANFVVPLLEGTLVVYYQGLKKIQITTLGAGWVKGKHNHLSQGRRVLFFETLEDLRQSTTLRHFVPAAEAAFAKANCIGCNHVHYAL